MRIIKYWPEFILVIILSLSFVSETRASTNINVCLKHSHYIQEIAQARNDGLTLRDVVIPYNTFNQTVIRFVYSTFGRKYNPIQHYNGMFKLCLDSNGNQNLILKHIKRLFGEIQT